MQTGIVNTVMSSWVGRRPALRGTVDLSLQVILDADYRLFRQICLNRESDILRRDSLNLPSRTLLVFARMGIAAPAAPAASARRPRCPPPCPPKLPFFISYAPAPTTLRLRRIWDARPDPHQKTPNIYKDWPRKSLRDFYARQHRVAPLRVAR